MERCGLKEYPSKLIAVYQLPVRNARETFETVTTDTGVRPEYKSGA